MATNVEQMAGGVYFAWIEPADVVRLRRGGRQGPARFKDRNVARPTSWGVLRRRSHLRQIIRRTRTSLLSESGEPFDPVGSMGHLTRLSVDLSKKSPEYDMEVLFSHRRVAAAGRSPIHRVLSIRLHADTDLETGGSATAGLPYRPNNCYKRFDQQTRQASTFFVGGSSSLQECIFVPRRKGAPEGDGYLVGIANRMLEGRSDLLLIDTDDLEEGPIATVRLPFKLNAGIHGVWIPGDALSAA
jgi:carotenoid cleavage dioxygenase